MFKYKMQQAEAIKAINVKGGEQPLTHFHTFSLSRAKLIF
jgi:hypothetical protein